MNSCLAAKGIHATQGQPYSSSLHFTVDGLLNSVPRFTEEEAGRSAICWLQVDVQRHEVGDEAQSEGAEEEAQGVGGAHEGHLPFSILN